MNFIFNNIKPKDKIIQKPKIGIRNENKQMGNIII